MSEVPQRHPAAPQRGARDAREPREPRGQGGAGSTPNRTHAALTGAVYGVLFLLGFGVGVYGSFYYSLSVWVVPLGAIVAIVVNFVMCRVIRHRLRARLPAVLAAAGWLLAVSSLASQRPEGDLVVTGTPAGYLLIVGGTVAAAVAVTAPSRHPGR